MSSCLKIQNDDFRGYPWVDIIDLWETAPVDPCLATPSSYIKRRFIHSKIDNLYRDFGGNLVNGVFFFSPGGKGAICKIVDGVMGPFSVNGLNMETCELGPGDTINTEILGYSTPTHSDIYDGYSYVVYIENQIVVKYEIGSNISGNNAVGTIFCGYLDKVDYGAPGEEEFLNNPSLIKIDPVSKNVIIYNSGVYKTFKEFDQSGNLVKTWSDINPINPSDTHLGFDSITDDIGYGTTTIKGVPTNKSGAMSRLSLKKTWDPSITVTQEHLNFGVVMSLDFYTNTSIGKKMVIFGVWYAYNNRFTTYLLIEKTSKTDTFNCNAFMLHNIPSVSPGGAKTSDMAVSYSLFNSPPSDKSSITVIVPKNLGDINDMKTWTAITVNFDVSSGDLSTISNITTKSSIHNHFAQYIMGPGIQSSGVLTRNNQVVANFNLVQLKKRQLIDVDQVIYVPYATNITTKQMIEHPNEDDLNANIEAYIEGMHEKVFSVFTKVMFWVTVASILLSIITKVAPREEIWISGGRLFHFKVKFRQMKWIALVTSAITVLSWINDEIKRRKARKKIENGWLSYNSATLDSNLNRGYAYHRVYPPSEDDNFPYYLNVDVSHNNDFVYGVSISDNPNKTMWIGEGSHGYLKFFRKTNLFEMWNNLVLYVPSLISE